MNDYAKQKRSETKRRTRLRAIGKLPPLPRCERCGHKCLTERWLPLCASCHRRPLRDPLCVAGEQLLEQIRNEPPSVPLQPLTELRGAVAGQTLLDYLDLATLAPEPGRLSVKFLRRRWGCSQPTVSRRLAAVQRAGLAEITAGWGGYQVHAVKRLEVVV